MSRPKTTLFLLISVDGKINSGDSDDLDVDRDWKRIVGVKEGLQQYYDLEKQTDIVSFNTGRVMKKIGVNDRADEPTKIPVSFVIVDNKPHLNERGVSYLTKWVKRLYFVTTNKNHPGFGLQERTNNLKMLLYPNHINFVDLFERLETEFGVIAMTVQSGGSMNAQLLRDGLIDHLSLVVAPLLVGGATTSTLIDGKALHSVQELHKLRPLKFVSCDILKDSYLHLRYDVLFDTVIDEIQTTPSK